MQTLSYDPASLQPQLRGALALLQSDRLGIAPTSSTAAATLDAAIDPSLDGVSRFDWSDGRLTLRGGTIPQVLRALALWRGFAATGSIPATYQQQTTFSSIGLMLDCSRNVVPTVDTVKLILRRMALLGMNQFMLYTEDTYEVPGKPLIGYLRGRFSQAELREIDDHAAALGIEAIPCIQALGHLEQMLRWPGYGEVSDTSGILLADEPKTYELLEEMIAAATGPFRTKRVHLGMDEAHDIGMGEYRRRHGLKPRFEILSSHLRQVTAICDRLGLTPMIWSDMYFRLASATGDYYSDDARIPPEVVGDIPANLQLVYWDYYHWSEEFYREWMKRHEVAGRDVLFASGVWTWNRFWLELGWTRVTAGAGLNGARRAGVREVFATAWGDDGGEADFLSVLQGLTFFAAAAYGETSDVSDEQLRREFRGAVSADWDGWNLNTGLDNTPALPTIRQMSGGKAPTDVPPEWVDSNAVNWGAANPSKPLLWQDPLLGVVDGNLSLEMGLGDHYRKLADRLEEQTRNDDGWGRNAFPLAMARVLADKAELGLRIRAAYTSGDRATLSVIADQVLPRVIEACHEVHAAHRKLWFSLYKPFGWEVIDCRYSALAARLATTRQRLRDFLEGRIEAIDELAEERQPVMPWPRGCVGHAGSYRRLISPSLIT